MSKREPRSSSGTSQAGMSKLSVTGGNQGHWQEGAQKIQGPDAAAQHWRWEQQENKASGFRELMVHSVKEVELMLRLSQRRLRQPQSHVERAAQLDISHQPQCQAAQQRQWIDSLCAYCICVNKTITFCQKKEKDMGWLGDLEYPVLPTWADFSPVHTFICSFQRIAS